MQQSSGRLFGPIQFKRIGLYVVFERCSVLGFISILGIDCCCDPLLEARTWNAILDAAIFNDTYGPDFGTSLLC
jgi:hypothetical protein